MKPPHFKPSNPFKEQLSPIKRKIRNQRRVVLTVPAGFSFNRGDIKNFEPVLSFFDWNLKDQPVEIDFTACSSASFQAISLLVLYCWHLKQKDCNISFKHDNTHDQSSSRIWHMLGAQGLFSVSTDKSINFKSKENKPLIAIRNFQDGKIGIERLNEFTKHFGVDHQKTLQYVLTELIYNTLEHGKSTFNWRGKRFDSPSILEFSWYEKAEELAILVGDTGMGVKDHLSQAYPGIESDEDALKLAIQPEISGNKYKQDPYTNKNNAGMGLFLSSNILRRLRAEMHIISGNGVMHISPLDVTSRRIDHSWHGCFALITIKLDQTYKFAYDQMMSELRDQARGEVEKRTHSETDNKHYVNIFNYFGRTADDKEAAINYRDRYLLKSIDSQKSIILDFKDVTLATHSFLNAFLASPIKRLGMQAYKKIKIINASPDIRETIDYVLDDNTAPSGIEPGKYDQP